MNRLYILSILILLYLLQTTVEWVPHAIALEVPEHQKTLPASCNCDRNQLVHLFFCLWSWAFCSKHPAPHRPFWPGSQLERQMMRRDVQFGFVRFVQPAVRLGATLPRNQVVFPKLAITKGERQMPEWKALRVTTWSGEVSFGDGS